MHEQPIVKPKRTALPQFYSTAQYSLPFFLSDLKGEKDKIEVQKQKELKANQLYKESSMDNMQQAFKIQQDTMQKEKLAKEAQAMLKKTLGKSNQPDFTKLIQEKEKQYEQMKADKEKLRIIEERMRLKQKFHNKGPLYQKYGTIEKHKPISAWQKVVDDILNDIEKHPECDSPDPHLVPTSCHSVVCKNKDKQKH